MTKRLLAPTFGIALFALAGAGSVSVLTAQQPSDAAAKSKLDQHKELGRMWPFEAVPADDFEARYGFRPSQEWLDQLRTSVARFGSGCSSSFVSPRGMILTNHHCARGNVASIADPEAGKDFLTDGYFATSLEQELPLPGLTVQQLVTTRDITAEMNSALEGLGDDTDAQAEKMALEAKQREIIAAAREADPDHTHEVVTLYQGGMFQLYSYRIYDDIRLVAVPEMQAAKFGGDPDNFTFPRYSLDYTLVRAWVDDEPADTSDHYLKVRSRGPEDGETVFVAGNPGSTGRLNTIAQMEFLRDVEYPQILTRIDQILGNLPADTTDPEKASRRLNILNAQKAYTGYLDGLRNEAVMGIKRKAEAAIRAAVEESEELRDEYADAWSRLEAICGKKAEMIREGISRGDLGTLQAEEEAIAKKIGEAYFAVYGTSIPPDATLSLRLSDGVVKGFPMNGTVAPWFTSLYGFYGRHHEFGGVDPFHLTEAWLDAEEKLDLRTPFNFVCTCDIIGGNSGSPIVDADSRLVGLVFDGNIESLGNRFVYTDDVARTVAVHPAIIIESLRTVYGQPKIADEFEGKGAGY